ncbi:ABC transporter ATP-binding protein [Halococcus hamelinensis]|uniref:ABC transporter ATP-binding protein n=1 Tax=Halococcus hamelinensis 100A6 TaxID=1132509 RepID=M0M437_9EURY|nr:ABC transporter ATP-binding protein [Halococcus hamelinensis]EMA39130.1 ABC transporter ATP-binding protein [Halococcus hamelinensis 100A6]
MPAALIADGVRREYGDTVALDGVSLSIDAGEVFALVGPNGAGKTTLVRALTGTTDVDGDVSVFGEPPTEVARARLGVLPQDFSPADRLTARELITYYAGLYDDPRDVETVLDEMGLADTADTRYGNLSGGQQRRTCVGATLVNDPDLLVLDEPTTGIDPAGRRALWELLEGLAAGGTTILLTTHYMAEAERLADRVGLLADGQVAAVGTPGELVGEYGGETRLEIETDAEPAALASTDHRVDSRGGLLVVEDVSATDISAVVAELDRNGVAYGELAWRQPDLEDVYLAVTGQAVGGGGDPVEEPARDPETGVAR